jgi:acyl-CoA synthetase (AMP-forming)/AMP-acid ligase II
MYSHLLSRYDDMAPAQQAAAAEAARKVRRQVAGQPGAGGSRWRSDVLLWGPCAVLLTAPLQQDAVAEATCAALLWLQLRLTVSGSAACPGPIMQRWRQLSGDMPCRHGSHQCARCLPKTPVHPHASAHSSRRRRLPLCLYMRACTAAGQVLLERYGMTETGMLMGNPYRGGQRRPGTVGRPFPGVAVRLTQEDGSDAGAGKRLLGAAASWAAPLPCTSLSSPSPLTTLKRSSYQGTARSVLLVVSSCGLCAPWPLHTPACLASLPLPRMCHTPHCCRARRASGAWAPAVPRVLEAARGHS